MTNTLFTIGYSGRSIDDFTALLQRHKITALCDVRSMLIDNEIVETQADLEKRLIAQLKLHADMFKDTDPNALTERAYEMQGDRIAYVEKGEREPDEIAAETVREEHECY